MVVCCCLCGLKMKFRPSLFSFLTLIVVIVNVFQVVKVEGASDGSQEASYSQIRQFLSCLVCRALIDEVEAEIDKVSPAKKVNVGSFRLDGDGNVKQVLVPYARSQLHLSEVMDRVCASFKDYTLANYKSSGRPTLLRVVTHDGNMNPEMSNVDIVPNPENNEKLAFFCQTLVEDFEDDIVSMFSRGEKEPHEELCFKTAGVCPESEEASNDDSEPYDFEHEEL